MNTTIVTDIATFNLISDILRPKQRDAHVAAWRWEQRLAASRQGLEDCEKLLAKWRANRLAAERS